MLIALGSHGRIAATDAARLDTHACPCCGAPVRLKRGRQIVAHFAHVARAACPATGETAAHLGAKLTMAAALRGRGVHAALEVPVLSGEGDRRADVLATCPRTGARAAIEVQHSALPLEAIAARTAAYDAAGVDVIWMGTLDDTALARASPRGPDGTRRVARYAAPAWQRFAEAMAGAIWFVAGDALWRGRFEPAWVKAGRRDRLDDDDAWMPARRAHDLVLEGPFAPGSVLLKLRAHRTQPHESFAVGNRIRPNLIAPGQAAAPGDGAAAARWRRPPGTAPARDRARPAGPARSLEFRA